MAERFRIESEPAPNGEGFIGKFVPDQNGPFTEVDIKRFNETTDLLEALEILAKCIPNEVTVQVDNQQPNNQRLLEYNLNDMVRREPAILDKRCSAEWQNDSE